MAKPIVTAYRWYIEPGASFGVDAWSSEVHPDFKFFKVVNKPIQLKWYGDVEKFRFKIVGDFILINCFVHKAWETASLVCDRKQIINSSELTELKISYGRY